jgi:predicted alpha-1,2-mannosidase
LKKVRFVFASIIIFATSVKAQDFIQYVNPMIGTGGNGHVFPGATVPFGMVQLSPDQRTVGWSYCSGYNYEEKTILGFSHTHLSGTGVGDLGDILVMPYVGIKSDTCTYPGKTNFSHLQEKSSPGFYEVFLPQPKILAELTASQRVGVHQYTFPKTNEAFININLIHKINSNSGKVIESEFVVENDSTFSGYRCIADGWAPWRKVYFVIVVSKPIKNIYMNSQATDLKNSLLSKGYQRFRNQNINVNLQFEASEAEKIEMKVALSAISVKNARKNLNEVRNLNFKEVQENAKQLWNRYLSRIQIDADTKVKEIFYTSLYHNLVQPNQMADPDSSFLGPDYQVHKSITGNYYSTFSLWDTYRATQPLYTLLVPELVPDMMNTLLQHESINGYLPIWSLWGTETHCMIANHSVPVLTDAILKGLKGIDAEKAFLTIKNSLTLDHRGSNWNAWRYDKYGYVRADSLGGSSVSKTLEFSYDDWCAAQLAKKLNKPSDYAYFMKRAGYYKNLFNPAKEMMWPKNSDGNWAIWNEYKTEYGGPYTEGNAWQYIWSVQHDPYGLIKLFPSEKECIKKLDQTFSDNTQIKGNVGDVSGLIGQYAHGNEPSHHIAYFYPFLGQPWKTQKLVRHILATQYDNQPDGLSGNEDCGQMSAWYIFSALGFYPYNPANGIYIMGSPAVNKAVIKVADGKTFTIIAKNNSAENIYVASVMLNGKTYNKTYIRHQDIEAGGVLEFKMSNHPNLKQTSKINRPPLE